MNQNTKIFNEYGRATRRSINDHKKVWSDGMYFREAWVFDGGRWINVLEAVTERKTSNSCSRVCERKNIYHSR